MKFLVQVKLAIDGIVPKFLLNFFSHLVVCHLMVKHSFEVTFAIIVIYLQRSVFFNFWER